MKPFNKIVLFAFAYPILQSCNMTKHYSNMRINHKNGFTVKKPTEKKEKFVCPPFILLLVGLILVIIFTWNTLAAFWIILEPLHL
jgi:hypothetical protein